MEESASDEFSCLAALQRMVARYPDLRDNSAIRTLFAKGLCIKDDDVLDVSAELLLQPDLTVSVIGCFRPLSIRIINTLVGLLQRLQSSGGCVNKDHEKLDTQEFFQIKLHLSKCWSLNLHEHAVIAFSRSLELAPFLLRSILQYFSFAPPPFQRLLQFDISILKTEEEAFHLLDIIRASYRFLHLEPKVFSRLWDWSPFLELLQWTCNSNKVYISSETASDIRWCAVQVLSVVLRMSDEATRYLGYKLSGLTEEMAFACLLRWEGFCQDVSLEKAGWYLESKKLRFDDFVDGKRKFLVNCDPVAVGQPTGSFKSYGLSLISHLEKFGMEFPVKKRMQCEGCVSTSSSFVMTSNIEKSLEVVILAVCQGQPLLLEGSVGVGKTMLINELAQITGNFDILFIHLDEEMDSKTLIGTYICTEIPGEFKWQPGSLTQAVVKGFWVVFEDIDKAPSDIISVLAPLLEDRKLYVPGQGEAIPAAEGFQLFATITKFQTGSRHAISGKETFSNLWRKVVIDVASNEDLIQIVKVNFPVLGHVAPKLIDTLEMVNMVKTATTSSFKFGGFASVYAGNRFSTRDLMKLCKRITDLDLDFDRDVLSCRTREHIFNEAVDIFAASVACKESRHILMKRIAELWNISHSQAEYLDQLNKPQIQLLKSMLQVGRVSLVRRQSKTTQERAFANTGNALRVLERIACAVKHNEPVLLVGETGTGKTTLVQHLATKLNVPLTVLNLSQQSDSTDFLGGFKPIEAQLICIPLMDVFNRLFYSTFSSEQNMQFLGRIQQFVEKKKWDQLLKAFQIAVDKVAKLVESESSQYVGLQPTVGNGGEKNTRKRKKSIDREVLEKWREFSFILHRAQRQIEASKSSFAFSFVEGELVKAMRNGHWILLDEVNLASPETLQRLSGVLEGDKSSLCLTEKGDVKYVTRHPDFRIFACMNPATDVGKRDLPFSIKKRFTEFFVDELLNAEDLSLFVNQYLEGMLPSLPVDDIVKFYKEARRESESRLLDGANQKPQYSLRSLARALEYARAATPMYGFQRALYDGICMLFLTMLDQSSSDLMEIIIASVLLKESGAMTIKALNSLLRAPPCPSSDHVQFEEYWIERGTSQVSKASTEFCKRYVLTKTIKQHLKNLARAVFIRKYPILLQGPTSSGKTSLIEYLATVTGHRFVRINNHEHTDLQEYLGRYVTDSSGKLVFQEGILVEAVQKGYWIVLDELNLAPSDVLEALNRLLDDNRELFVPELQMTFKPHPHFMLFATQNPPGTYGGRKVLSRAFRNRFLELHVDDIPAEELCMILEKRCEVPPSYASKMVEVLKDLQRHRQSSNVFAGKHGFITPRDLFRWADRFRRCGKSYEDLAMDGYMLLAERLRDVNEKAVVQRILEKHLRVKIDIGKLYSEDSTGWQEIVNLSMSCNTLEALGKVVWTKSLRRLFYLVKRCYEQREPVLLVGETGCGKTTVCQLLSLVLKCYLHILNCHQHTESSDFLGGFRPVRERNNIAGRFQEKMWTINASKVFNQFHECKTLSSNVEDASITLDTVRHVLDSIKSSVLSEDNGKGSKLYDTTKDEIDTLEYTIQELVQLHKDWQSLFLWHDGPLVQAMKSGHFFLVDEISLADDSVLERLNSVLEPSRLLVLAEKGGPCLEELIAHPQFFLMATMNPGGDFGKKELSPALRNRFTEIWVPAITDLDDLRNITINRFSKPELLYLADPLLNFWKWFHNKEVGRVLTVRDLLSWITFMNTTEKYIGTDAAFLHGAYLVLLDGFSLGFGLSNATAEGLKDACLSFLLQQLHDEGSHSCKHLEGENFVSRNLLESINKPGLENNQSNDMFGIHPFYIMKGGHVNQRANFELSAPTTSKNGLRILRAMQLNKPVLLEGSPGVGKTSLVAALANSSKHNLVRINLSEQTDIMDLLGSDLPVEGTKGIEFQWSDGILLQALKAGSWVVLDELNLAPQSVLEGLNAILDHRGEVYVPELGQSFKCPPSFRLFACQNPSHQGGGRKGLPKSFLNRFTKVFVDALHEDDFLFISSALYPSIPRTLLTKLIEFNAQVHIDTMVQCKYGQTGSPWEFNLRDVLRSCHLIEGSQVHPKEDCFLNIVYLQRMRTYEDRQQVLKLYEEVFGASAYIKSFPKIRITPKTLFVGEAALPRNTTSCGQDISSKLHLLPGFANSMEAVTQCVSQGWMCILVGPSSSGKTSMIRLLAELTGNTLHEYNLSDGTDTSELLGCFEQYDAFRHWNDTILESQRYLEELCAACLGAPAIVLSAERSKIVVKDLLDRWAAFQMCINAKGTLPVFSSATDKNTECGPINHLAVGLLIMILECLKKNVSEIGVSVSWSVVDIETLMKKLRHFEKSVDKKGIAGHFEWINGGLIRALERGEWVSLENANLCNPTVLDRLNSLLEPSGSITVNERGIVNGEPMVVYGHAKFRLFLTVNPNNGEVSRAMRNRGIEIYLMQPNWLVPSKDSEKMNASSTQDLKKILTLSGIPISNLIDSMANMHASLKNEVSCFGIILSLREFVQWIQLFQQLLVRGGSLFWCLYRSWEQIYLHSLYNIEAKNAAFYLMKLHFSDIDIVQPNNCFKVGLSLPGGWPTPLELRKYLQFSREAIVKRDCMYLEFVGAQWTSLKISLDGMSSFSKERNDMEDRFLLWLKSKQLCPSFSPSYFLRYILFPSSLTMVDIAEINPPLFDSMAIESMLFSAATWMIEQASSTDLELRICWLSWFASKVVSYCPFFSFFVTILEKEKAHPILKCLASVWQELKSLFPGNLAVESLPYFSTKSIKSIPSSEITNPVIKRLQQLIKRVLILRCIMWQWNTEDEFNGIHNISADKSSASLAGKICVWLPPVLKSLRELENEVLIFSTEFVCDENFDELFMWVQECHVALWKSANSPIIESDLLMICWQSVKKFVARMLDHVPNKEYVSQAFESFKHASKNLDGVLCTGSNLSKPYLWKYGGHPMVTASSENFIQQQHLLDFCHTVWPVALQQGLAFASGKLSLEEISVSANLDLRYLTVQGVTMALCMVNQGINNGSHEVVKDCEEIYKMLSEKVEGEKNSLGNKFSSNMILYPRAERFGISSNSCKCYNHMDNCFPSEILCSSSAYDLWVTLLPLPNMKSLRLDLMLLNELSESCVCYVTDQCQDRAALNVTESLITAIRFGLQSTSRSPLDFVPHQKCLWMIDANTLDDNDSTMLSCTVHEMWFRWHSALWTVAHEYDMKNIRGKWNEIQGPLVLFKATRTAVLSSILEPLPSVKDHSIKLLQLKVASAHVWRDFKLRGGLCKFVLCTASILLQQIILAHNKSFNKGHMQEIQSIFFSLHQNAAKVNEGFDQQLLERLKSLLKESKHERLAGLSKSFIQPLMQELYSCFPMTGESSYSLFKLARVWLLLGGLRLRLLVCPHIVDPVKKSMHKYNQLLEKISQLEIDIKVRQECEILAGGNPIESEVREKLIVLEKLKKELHNLACKVVYRPDPSQYKTAIKESLDFMESMASSSKIETLMNHLEYHTSDLPKTTSEVQNWQDISTAFILRLSKEYAAYKDIVQPIQLAIYELKFGLSLAVGAALEKHFCNLVGASNFDKMIEVLSLLMEFPSRPLALSSITFSHGEPKNTCNTDCQQLLTGEVLKLLSPPIISGSAGKEVVDPKSQVVILQICLVRTTSSILQTLIMDSSSMQLLNTIFSSLTSLWLQSKELMKEKALHEAEAEAFQFKSRSCKIGDDAEIDDLSFNNLSIKDNWFSEWEDISSEAAADQDKVEYPRQENEKLEETWTSIEESVLLDVVKMHGRLFGSTNLVQYFENVQILDDERLYAFSLAYEAGKKFIEGYVRCVGYSLPATLDDNILSGHLLHLCLAHQKLSQSLVWRYNIYKDSNTSEIALMVEPLVKLKGRVDSLLIEWPEHPGLQQILQIICSLLDIPLTAPLIKALTGVQFLLHRSQLWEENAPRVLSLADELRPLSSLVGCWRKVEFDCWPALMDAAEKHHEVNAEKLWYALYSILFRTMSDSDVEIISTISSLEEYMQTATLGEFRKRLELLLTFHGHLFSQVCLEAYPTNMESALVMKLSSITYNLYGYYMQFLPLILESIESGRKIIEKELKECSVFCKWDDHRYYPLIESSKKTHQKLRKLIQKFNEILKRPVMELLKQEKMKFGSVNLDSSNFKTFEGEEIQSQFEDLESSTAGSNWHQHIANQLQSTSQIASDLYRDGMRVYQQKTPLSTEKVGRYLSEAIFSKIASDMRQEGYESLKMVWRSVLDRAYDLRNTEIKRSVKKKALTDLLKLLRSIGLSRYKSTVPEEERDTHSYFLQPCFNVTHLLDPKIHSKPIKMDSATDHFESLQFKKNDLNWRLANGYYFKNMALMVHLKESHLSFHKDLSLQEVKISSSFLEHLLYLQRKQRRTAYEFSSKLEQLSKLSLLLKDFGNAGVADMVVIPYRQHAIHRLMWDQKHIFDSLCSVSSEISLLLKAVGSVHGCPLTTLGGEVKKLQVFFDKHNHSLKTSKVSLDKYLLGGNLIAVNSNQQSWPFIVSKEMDEVVQMNFMVIKKMQEDILTLYQDCNIEYGSMPSLTYLSDLLQKGMQLFHEFMNDTDGLSSNINELNTLFVESHEKTISAIMIAVQNIKKFNDRMGHHGSPHTQVPSLAEENMDLGGTLQTWESLFSQQISNLRLDTIEGTLFETITAAVKLINHGAQDKTELYISTGKMLGSLYLFVRMIISAGKMVLFDYVNMHKTVAKLDYILSNIFVALYTDGFCVTKEDPENEGDNLKFEDATGTGMGEGEGAKDVSDQIQDEDQLLGGSDKPSEEPSASAKGPREDDKGIEMEQDFSTSDMHNVSEDSGDDSEEDDGDVNLDSAMGETGEDEEVVDEQLWNKEDDAQPQNKKERYETGASVQDTGADSMELRAKQDMDDGETGRQNKDDKEAAENDDMEIPDNSGASNDVSDIPEELTMNKDDAYSEPTGVEPNKEEEFVEPNKEEEFKINDDMEVDEPAGSDEVKDESDSCLDDMTTENNMQDGEYSEKEDSYMEDCKQVENDSIMELQQDEKIENSEIKENSSGGVERSVEAYESSLQLGTDQNLLDFQHIPNMAKSNENHNANQGLENSINSEVQNDNILEDSHADGHSSMGGVLNAAASELPSSFPDNGKEGRSDPNAPSSSERHLQSLERMSANPFRSIGDALKDWKERVKVSDTSSQDPNTADSSKKVEDLDMDGGDEFQFVCEEEQSHAQALGAATADQLGQNPNMNNSIMKEEDVSVMENPHFTNETEEIEAHDNPILEQNLTNIKNKMKTENNTVIGNDSSFSKSVNVDMAVDYENQERDPLGSFVSIERQHQHKILYPNNVSTTSDSAWTEEDNRKLRREIEMIFKEHHNAFENASVVWAKYEQLTTRLSQDLAEQLRLIMEPTLANRLEGDYQTGKRINMKKVIPYIASQFRKDKIWLRRTKPNKRQYQVVLALDDSRSMSENHCGHMALEALITICKAMSQLEVGQLAVASFGAKGNVRLLHDFDQPFSSEAGLQMISKFSFKQDNTIEDEPVVDLLTYLTRMLDHVAMNLCGPSSRPEIQQLVLIIADGRFHEKESLKRCVRDALSRKQLLAFIVLDNPEESILDVQSVSFTGGVPTFSKYLDSFPFPYYIILKSIEALPRTLADLLRQWFELMQTTNS
ncbi:midasin isoform X2 [Cryptomeria japonica]|uniref:midasin isoform X2 n=1 Tax=Cryptomeria japonica TaxID=3369 RepID=UPI0027D9F101|nr:midasin isoform X2 [Cryptomeria japonica]